MCFSAGVASQSRMHFVVQAGSFRVAVVTEGLIPPGVHLASGTGKPLLVRMVQELSAGCCHVEKYCDVQVRCNEAQFAGGTASVRAPGSWPGDVDAGFGSSSWDSRGDCRRT
jgi:hypothetical protein